MRMYLVVESILLIGEDLAHAIRDFDPDAEVLVTMHEGEALARMAGRLPILRAFLHSSPDDADKTDLGRRLAASGTACFYIGDKAERSGKDAVVLHRPFDSISVATFLSQFETA